MSIIAKVQIWFNQPIPKPYCKLAIKALLCRKSLIKWNHIRCSWTSFYAKISRRDHSLGRDFGCNSWLFVHLIHSRYIQFSSFTQSCLTLCNPMECSTPGFPVHHQLPKLAQTHVRWIGDAIQPSHPLMSPSPLAFNVCQHQGLFQWVSSSHQVVEILELQLQHQSFQWLFQDWFPLGWTGLISLQSKGLSSVFSNTTVQKHQFFSAQLSLW